jgi:asparagine synthase (glutamine-hydrolysing)
VNTVESDDRGVTVTVLGSCSAPLEELRRCLTFTGVERHRRLATLPGSFRAVVRSDAETVIVGDLVGRAPVYVASDDEGPVWATAATPLAALVGGTERPELVVLDMLASGIPQFGGEAPYTDVEVVPGGSLLRIGPGGHRVERWYRTGESLTLAQAGSSLREGLLGWSEWCGAAGGVWTADVSGIDSSALAVLAARLRDVVGITRVDDADREAVEDVWRMVQSVTRLHRRLVTSPGGVSHFAGLGDPEALPFTDLPSSGLVQLAKERAVLEAAAAAGSTDHVKGWGGDLVFSARLASLAPLLRAGRPLPAIAAALAAARDERVSQMAVSLAIARLSGESYRHSLRRVARAVRKSRVDPAVEPDPWQLELNWAWPLCVAGMLTPEAARWASERLEQLAEQPPEQPDPARTIDWWVARRAVSRLSAVEALAASYGIAIHTPYLQTWTLDTCLLRLIGERREPAGTFKPLATEQLASLIPAALASTTSKDRLRSRGGIQLGLRQHEDQLRALIASDDSYLVRAGLLKRSAIADRLGTLLSGSDSTIRSLLLVVAAELWFAQRDLRLNTWWEEDPEWTMPPQTR